MGTLQQISYCWKVANVSKLNGGKFHKGDQIAGLGVLIALYYPLIGILDIMDSQMFKTNEKKINQIALLFNAQ